ncbi:MAG: hypothetical protein KJN71_06255 [Acidimicrobiia bacterium]|nr:hypothetical protein [Acidimicrobiia bacterium]
MTDEKPDQDYEELFNELRAEGAGQRAPSGWTAIIGLGAVAVLMVGAAFMLASLGPGASISSAGDVDHVADRAPNISLVLIKEETDDLTELVDLHLAYMRWLAYHPTEINEARRSMSVRSPAIERAEEVMTVLSRTGTRVDLGEMRVESLVVVSGSAMEGQITVEIVGSSDGERITESLVDGSTISRIDTAREFVALIVLKQSSGPDDLNWRISEMPGIPFFSGQ